MIDFDKMSENYFFREDRKKELGRYYPSEIGNCLRKTWYSYNHPRKTDPNLIRIFELGNMIHELVAKILKSDKNPEIELLEEETSFKQVEEEFTISGRIDDLILVKENNAKVLVEVKSAKSIDYVNEPSPQYEDQLQYYMHVTGVHSGIILYIDKTNLKSKTFVVQYEKEKAEKVVRRFRFLHDHLKQGKLPFAEAKIEPKKNFMCRFCEYADKCEKDEE